MHSETLTDGPESDGAYVFPLLCDLHWITMAERIQFKSLMLVYRVTSGSAPIYLNTIIQASFPSRPLHSSNEQHCLVMPSLHSKAISIQTVLICNFLIVGQATNCIQNRSIPLYFQESPEGSSLPRTHPLLTPVTP